MLSHLLYSSSPAAQRLLWRVPSRALLASRCLTRFQLQLCRLYLETGPEILFNVPNLAIMALCFLFVFPLFYSLTVVHQLRQALEHRSKQLRKAWVGFLQIHGWEACPIGAHSLPGQLSTTVISQRIFSVFRFFNLRTIRPKRDAHTKLGDVLIFFCWVTKSCWLRLRFTGSVGPPQITVANLWSCVQSKS